MSLCGNNNPCPDLITGQKCGITYTGARYVPLFADPAQWDNTRAYEPLTIVLNQGNSYTSKTFVPVGVDIGNEDYWALTGNYNAQVEAYRQEVEKLKKYSIAQVDVLDDAKTMDLTNVNYLKTLGYYSINDGGEGLYKISLLNGETDNGGSIIICGNYVLKLIAPYYKLKQFGAVGDGVTNDTEKLTNAINASDKLLVLNNGVFKIDNITVNKKISLYGENATLQGNSTLNYALASNSISGSLSGSTITSTSTTGFEIDETICVSDGELSYYTQITGITPTTITLSFTPPFVLKTSVSIYKVDSEVFYVDSLVFNGVNLTLPQVVANTNVVNCQFYNANLTGRNTYKATIKNNNFKSSVQGIFLINPNECIIESNAFISNNRAIRLLYPYMNEIKNNNISNGNLMSYGIGIEITSNDDMFGLKDKGSYNLIEGNRVLNSTKGRPGSAIGGIHLNYNCNHNKIINNISMYNSIGIYLENSSSYNLISDNICNYNSGYYGVGIELDWNCHSNVISNNDCSYNNGETQANEGSGIIIRNNSENPDYFNLIKNNTLRNNGNSGVFIRASYTTLEGNTFANNGTNSSYSQPCDLNLSYSSNCVVVSNIFNSYNNYCIVSDLTTPCDYISIISNIFKTANAQNSIVINGKSNIVMRNNNVTHTGNMRFASIYGVQGAPLKVCIVTDNIINNSNSTFKTFTLTYCDLYYGGNNFVNNAVFYAELGNCTNPISMYAPQA